MILIKFLKSFKLVRIIFFFWLGALLGLGVIFLILTLMIGRAKKLYDGRVYPGVYLFSTSVSGKTVSELEEFLTEKEKEINQQKIILLWKNNEEKRWEIIPQMIEFSLDRQGTINELMVKGRAGRGWQNLAELYRLMIIPQAVKPTFNFSQEKLGSLVSQIASEINRPVQDALFEFKNKKVVNFQVSKEGLMVDEQSLKPLIVLAFTRQSLKNSVVALDLPVKVIKQKITTEQTNDLGIKEKLAEGESFFQDSIPGRVHNIILASSYLHGIVIPPGEVFSFAEKIGTVSAETGYKQAYVIKEKKTILEDGGGLCQVSTTMFRAALSAGLPIIERQAHYYRVGFYEQGGYPPGLDATVYPPSPDLKFRNDTSTYLLIQTSIDKEKKRLAFEFYGTADGRKVELTKPKIHSQIPPPEPIYVDEPSLPMGVEKRIDVAHWGAKVSFKRTVHNADGSLKEEKEFWSNYVPWPAVYQRGTGQ